MATGKITKTTDHSKDVEGYFASGTGAGTVYYYRRGDIVTVVFENVNYPATGWGTCGTIPAELRPVKAMYGQGTLGAYQKERCTIRVAADGSCQVVLSSGTAGTGVYGNVTYVMV